MADSVQSNQQTIKFPTVDESLQAWANFRQRHTLLFSTENISRSEALNVRMELITLDDEPLDIIIKSPGGDAHAAYKIANHIHARASNTTIFVVDSAKSAATLLTISMDEIVMDGSAELGPIDTQIVVRSDIDDHNLRSTLEIVQGMRESRKMAAELWTDAADALIRKRGFTSAGAHRIASMFVGEVLQSTFRKVNPDRYGHLTRMLDVTCQYAARLLVRHQGMSEENAQKLAKQLAERFPSHGFVIDLPEVKSLKLNARSPSPAEESSLFTIEVALMISPRTRIKLYSPAAETPPESVSPPPKPLETPESKPDKPQSGGSDSGSSQRVPS